MAILYTNKAIVTSTILGGPLAAGYMIYKNYRAFQYKKALLYSILLFLSITVIGIIIAVFLSEVSPKLPGLLITVIEVLIVYKFVREFQNQKINEHLNKGFQKASIKNIIFVIVLSNIVYLVVILLPLILCGYIL